MSDDLRTYIDSKVGGLEARVRGIENSNARSEVHHGNVEKRLGSIEGSLTWIVRLLLGAMFIAVVSALGLKA